MTWVAIESGAEARLPGALGGLFQVTGDDAAGWCVGC
jgi:hypothetical protein